MPYFCKSSCAFSGVIGFFKLIVLIGLAGMPATIVKGGTVVPARTTEPAAMTE